MKGQVETVWVIGGYSSYKVSARGAADAIPLRYILTIVTLF